MGFLSSAIGAIGGIASTVLGNNSAKKEAQTNRDWQDDMSNTSVQRRVVDLKAAGLNPLLAVSSASSGASTPTGAQAQIQRFNPADVSALASARLVSAQAKAQEQQNSVFEVKADSMKLQNELMKQGILTAGVERELKIAQTDSERAKILTEAYKRANIKASTDKINNEAMLLGIKTQPYIDNPYLSESEVKSNIFSNPFKAGAAFVNGFNDFLIDTAKHVFSRNKKGAKK